MRPTWLLRLGVLVGAVAHLGPVVFAQDMRPTQAPYSKPQAAEYRASSPQISPAAANGWSLLAVSTDEGGQTSGGGVPQKGGGFQSSGPSAAGYPLGAAPPLPMGSPVPLDLETALRWTLANNPNLVTIRQNLAVSASALAVARRFPTSLNPSVSVDLLPWVFEPVPGGGVNRLQPLVSVTWSQPIELGHRQAFRESIASSQYDQTHWNVLEAELLTLVQTYRLHQTATYRRQKLEVAERLAAFNRRLADVLRRRMEANQAPAADVVLADVESQVASQKAAAAQQEYFAALSALRQQIGNPEYAASAEPVGELRCPGGISPGGEDALVDVALASQPEIRAAEAQAAASQAALCLARADRIPVPSIGPHYEKDESGVSFYGMSVSTPVPLWNAGRPLVAQREAEHRRDCVALEQLRRRVITEVKAALSRWNQARESVSRTEARLAPIQSQSARMERLFEANETDIIKLLQVQQRSIEAEDAHLDVLWQATQAYADLITPVGIAPLLASLPADRAAE
jgi:outer membrane protein, heavy metal efflux system